MKNSPENKAPNSIKLVFVDKENPVLRPSVVWPGEDLDSAIKTHMDFEETGTVRIVDVPIDENEEEIVLAMKYIDLAGNPEPCLSDIIEKIASAVKNAYSKS